MSSVRNRLHERRWSGVIVGLAENLIEWPIVTNNLVRESYSVSSPTAQHAIDRLVEIGVVIELTGKNYARVYGTQEVMRLVESL